MRHRHGDTFSLRVPPYIDNLVFYTSLEYIKEIFVAEPKLLHVGEGN